MSFAQSLDKIVTGVADDVGKFVNSTGDKVAGFLKNAVDGIRSNSFDDSTETMGSTTSKTAAPKPSTALVPPFSVAYGVNESGKTVLYPIDVSREFPGQDEKTLAVRDLQTALSGLTKVPVENQALLHKGAHLNGDQLLASLKIREGSKMMMLGKAPPDPDEATKKSLSLLEDEISSVSMEHQEVLLGLDSVAASDDTRIRSAHKTCLRINEHFMKIMMKIDALEIPSDRSEMRAKRKALVDRVHSEMTKTDETVARCTQLMQSKTSPGPQKKFRSREPSPA